MQKRDFIVWGAIAALSLAVGGVMMPSIRMVAITFLCYGIAALGLIVLMRAGQVSFGHAMFAALSGYVCAFLARAFPWADAILLLIGGTLASTLFGIVLATLISRYRGIFFGMLNLGISMALVSLAGKLYSWTGGTDGLRFERPTLFGMTLARGEFELALLLVALVLAFGLVWLMQRYFDSAAGQVMTAIRTNETRLEYLGLSARASLAEGYVISAALLGVSGALLALAQGLITPESGYWLRSGEYVFIAILGGAGHALGAFLGAAMFEIIKMVASIYFTNLWQTLLGATLIAVIFFSPTGMMGWLERGRRRKEARGRA